jgi:NAD(P)-dependent dehydrogenase (short-subunit alcohol dehydrogenase family)
MSKRTAVVTGGARGLGQAIVVRLAQDGCDIAILDTLDAGETKSRVAAAGQKVASWRADISDPAQVAAAAKEISERFGRVGVLVNNAGIYPNTPFESLEFDEWRRVLAVNLDAQFLTCKAFVPGMREAGWGRIVCISSNSCWLQVQGVAHYVASKLGVIGLVRVLATELAAHGITVNAVAPTLTRTPGTDDGGVPPEFFDFAAQLQSIKRPAMPEDVVGTVSFLVGDDAAFMTGQTLMTDGGAVRL